ncbi:MAG: hypothetical protein HYX77_01825 [Acidobacteria bacterium]|nr:hypothetical protein [Acidobacteriota bacterium]
MRLSGAVVPLLILLVTDAPAGAAEHPALAKARALYNAADYDGAISAATVARADPASADAATLVVARSSLERYRLRLDPGDLVAARQALNAVRPAALSPRDHLDLLVGFGQALYLGEAFGAAAELFDTALSRSSLFGARDRLLLLEWWATAVDREAQKMAADRRMPLLERVIDRMENELRRDPGNAAANYWLAVSARGAGDGERAWQAAVAGWIRALLSPESAEALRADLDRFVTLVLIPERARTKPPREQQEALAALRAEWDGVKSQWR